MGVPRGVAQVLRRSLPALTVLLLGALLYDGWIFYSRYRDAREGAREAEQQESDDARRTLDLLGGNKFAIRAFYAPSGVVKRGRPATLCYSVIGAAKLRLEPGPVELPPALSRCREVNPLHDTVYKLIAEDAAGQTATATLTLRVEP